ncbi:hypothetical protein [Methanospirillum sp.]
MSNISILVNRFRHLFYSPAFGGPDLGGAYLLLHSTIAPAFPIML